MDVKIGLILSTAPQTRLVEIARRAEALGYESLWMGEHIVLPIEDSEEHPYGRPAVVSPRNDMLEPLTALATLAGATSRVRLATGVLLPPLRNLFATARQIMTLDLMSGGRLDIGVGVGWHEGEFALMGADFATRGPATDEFIDAMDRLFADEEPSFQGRLIAFPKVGFEPKPAQKPRVPILVGGDTGPAMRRAALRGDGWYGHAKSPEEGRERMERVNRLVSEQGRDPAAFQRVVQVWDPPSPEDLAAYVAAGADRLVCSPFGQGRDPIEVIEAYADKIGLRPA